MVLTESYDDREFGAASAPTSEALLRAIIETAPDALITIDERGRIELFNPAAERLFGCTAADVVGRNVKVLMPSPYREEHDRYIARYLETGEKRIIGIGRAVIAQRMDGTTFPIELAVGEVRLPDRRLFAGFVRDISERHQAQRREHQLQSELAHVSRLSAMGEMASALAHELNQPLTAIMNYVQACRRLATSPRGVSPDRLAELMDKAASQVSRAGQIIARLRQFMASGETERTVEDINKVVEEASHLALVGAAEKGIRFRLKLDPGPPPVLIDKIQIQQVVLNLMRNGIEALEEAERRELVVSTVTSGPGGVEVAVADTGPGLADEVAAQLFQPFVTTKPGGMGIGLSICRSIIDAHGGRIWAEPTPGGGATFRLILPLAPADHHDRGRP
jgi:two-component system, LuxR family, sensor kinase FixL